MNIFQGIFDRAPGSFHSTLKINELYQSQNLNFGINQYLNKAFNSEGHAKIKRCEGFDTGKKRYEYVSPVCKTADKSLATKL